MDDEIRRVADTILRAPLTRRTFHELLYCGFGGLVGVVAFPVTVVILLSGLTISASIIGTVVGLLIITLALRLSRRLGALHRHLLKRLLGYEVEPPPRFQPGTGILGRLDKRLRDRAGWRVIWYTLIKLPVAAVQLYAVTVTAFGVITLSYPAIWLLFHQHTSSSLTAVVPVPFVGGVFRVSSWIGTFPVAILAAATVVAATWLARGINAADPGLGR